MLTLCAPISPGLQQKMTISYMLLNYNIMPITNRLSDRQLGLAVLLPLGTRMEVRRRKGAGS